VAVRADEIALRDLGEDVFAAPISERSAELNELPESGSVIPLHDFGRERPAAVCARLSVFQTPEPSPATPLRTKGLIVDGASMDPFVALVVVEPSTRVADRVDTVLATAVP